MPRTRLRTDASTSVGLRRDKSAPASGTLTRAEVGLHIAVIHRLGILFGPSQLLPQSLGIFRYQERTSDCAGLTRSVSEL